MIFTFSTFGFLFYSLFFSFTTASNDDYVEGSNESKMKRTESLDHMSVDVECKTEVDNTDVDEVMNDEGDEGDFYFVLYSIVFSV